VKRRKTGIFLESSSDHTLRGSKVASNGKGIGLSS
jgi:parallel beta-helix repeat protein